MIVWKVIRSKDRSSLFSTGKYKLYYEKGSIVSAVPGTLGIMCFKTKREAIQFGSGLGGTSIVKLRTIGRGKVPEKICREADSHSLNLFYKKSGSNMSFNPLIGTRCYPKVEVLDLRIL